VPRGGDTGMRRWESSRGSVVRRVWVPFPPAAGHKVWTRGRRYSV
jgi:hypothetical protein